MFYYPAKIASVAQSGFARDIQPAALQIAKPPQPPTISQASLWHAGRDLAGQALGRTIGLSVLVALTHIESGKLPVQILAAGAGAIAAGTQAYLIGKYQIGTTSALQKTAVGLCTVTAAAAGGSIAALGTMPAITVLASCSIATATTSLLKFLCAGHTEEHQFTNKAKAVALGVATAVSLSGMFLTEVNWSTAESTFAARSIASLAEAAVIELCKSSLEQYGPSVDRNLLNFESKAGVSLMGLLPYYAATILFNGVLSAKLQPANDSHAFLDLWGALTIGSLANAVRGAANAGAAYLHHMNKANVTKPDTSILRPHRGVQQPALEKMAKKTAVRFFLSSCRNAVYFSLREKGMSILAASCIAQACYAVFAQNRDLIYDLMQGEGWSEPVLVSRSGSNA